MAPAKERRHSPQEGISPRQDDAQGDFAVVGGVCLSGGHHGAVALIGENSQGDQGNDAYRVKRTQRFLSTCVIHTLQITDGESAKSMCRLALSSI